MSLSLMMRHHALLAAAAKKGGSDPTSIRIGEHDYPVVRIGNLLWTAEDLHEVIGSTGGSTSADYLLKNGKYFYKWDSLLIGSQGQVGTPTDLFSQVLPSGWRIPTYKEGIISEVKYKGDWDDLFNYVEYNGDKLRLDKTNDSGFSAVKQGYWFWANSSHEFMNYYASSRFCYLTSVKPSGNGGEFMKVESTFGNPFRTPFSTNSGFVCYVPVRLCCGELPASLSTTSST